MEYKKTLNLPKTSFPMKADLVRREPARLARWEASGLYGRLRAMRAGAPRFVLHDGPPFANGDVHVGTALNKVLKDFVVKFQSMMGKDAPYVPGWDCHGLPIEFKVAQEMRQKGEKDFRPAEVRRRCAAYALQFVDLQRRRFQRLGVFGDWEAPYLTLDKEYEAEELRLFAELVEQGLVYRGKKPVYWSIPCRTALAEAEVEYRDHLSESVFVKFPVLGLPRTFAVIWTTTAWTLPANLAIAFHPKLHYAQVLAGEETFLVAVGLLDSLAEKFGWTDYQIVRTLEGAQLEGMEYCHPFCERSGRFLAAEFVEAAAGTGFVHVAPGHGLEDYGLGKAHRLPVYSPVDDEGRLSRTDDLPVSEQMGEELLGKSILERNGSSEANKAALALLQSRGALLHQEAYRHSYPHCWRSKTPVVFRAMEQWFIGMDRQDFRQKALAEIERVRWLPEWGKNRIQAAVWSRPDWCISRQRAWGVPIPAFYDADGRPILNAEVVRRTATLVEKHGSSIWFEAECAALWNQVRPADWTGAEPKRKSAETLDVWFDSGSSSRAVILKRPELRPHSREGLPGFQADLYLEGSDQHRGWFQSSLLLSLAGNGAAPYRSVLTHGFLVDADREKISKSLQGQSGGQKPQDAKAYVEKHGADVLRLWVASQDFRNDIVVSEERIRKAGETYRGIRNAFRYQLSNLYDFDPSRDGAPESDWNRIDRWILWRLERMEAEVLQAYERHEFHAVCQKLSQFATVDLSAIYHDAVKDRLYTLAARHPKRRSAQTALHRLASQLSRLWSPILAFTADEVWEHLPGEKSADSVHLSLFQPTDLPLGKEEQEQWEKLFSFRDRALLALETKRRSKEIGKPLEAVVVIQTEESAALERAGWGEDLREALNVSRLTFVSGKSAGERKLDKRLPNEADGVEGDVQVFAAESLGMRRCERCWRWESAIGVDPSHPGLCFRCTEAVAQNASPPGR